jgi:hypothetical protein
LYKDNFLISPGNDTTSFSYAHPRATDTGFFSRGGKSLRTSMLSEIRADYIFWLFINCIELYLWGLNKFPLMLFYKKFQGLQLGGREKKLQLGPSPHV